MLALTTQVLQTAGAKQGTSLERELGVPRAIEGITHNQISSP